jgi:hypothetical protein
MRWPFFLAAIVIVAPVHSAAAQVFPKHSDICVGGIVSKVKLAKVFLKIDPSWYDLYVGTLESSRDPQFVWQRIFTDDNFCKNNPACLGPDPDAKPARDPNVKPVLNTVAAGRAIERLRVTFRDSLIDNTAPGQSYAISSIPRNATYFAGDDRQNAITCLANEPVMAARPPSFQMPSNLRLRAASDDLRIPSDDPAFQGVTPATISLTRDGTGAKTNTAKLQAALGYAINLRDVFPDATKTSGYFDGEFVPFISATQSTTKVAGKPATLADTNNVAVGALFNTAVTNSGIDHYFTAKPQYLWNTKDKSEISSLRAVYVPSSYSSFIPVNVPFHRSGIWMTLLFDLRTDVGEYTKVGIDPMTALTHTSFVRSGSQYGFSVSTDTTGPHLTLNVTETMMYGFQGSVRRLSYFDSNLSYYFDSTERFAFTVKYTKGQNEDTTEWAQTLTAGFSAKF